MIARSEISLLANRPTAEIVANLFTGVDIPVKPSVSAISRNGVRIAGVTLVFNNQREPTMVLPFSFNS